MFQIITPATSANLGVGFDCLGIALDIQNIFYVEPSDSYVLEGVEEAYANEDNLFIQSYKKACAYLEVEEIPLHVIFESHVPISRGLGSSATLIVGGIIACFGIHKMEVDKLVVLQLASSIEGHPDNVAPCIYGGLCSSYKIEGGYETIHFPVDPSLLFTTFIPDFEVSTEQARSLLPREYNREDVVKNLSNILAVVKGFETGNISQIRLAEEDKIHEPYRRPLICGFHKLHNLFLEETEGVLLISGSGSTCLGISKKVWDKQVLYDEFPKWNIVDVKVNDTGVLIKE